MNSAVFKAEYADWKLIKTRSCVQVVFEVPIEQEKAAYLVLKGMPDPAGSRWFEISRLNPETASESEVMQNKGPSQHDNTSPRPSTPQAGGAKSYAQEAGRLCKDRRFQQFLGDVYGYIVPDSDAATRVIYELCDVDTRRDLIEGTPAAQNYKKIVTAYELEKVA